MAQLTLRIDGDKELADKLRKFGVAILNLQDGMQKTGTYLTGFFSGEVFASRGGVISERWAPLNPGYAAEKAQQFPGRPPLIRTGLMNRSFKSKAGRLSVLINNSDPKFDYHQGGTRRIPARVMMKVDTQREIRIVDIIQADITRHMGRAGV